MKKIVSSKGFTVLELIVVVGILALITSLSTKYLVKEANQQRAAITMKRIDQIRYAIIGDSSRTLNNQPAFSGYIADTGQLPRYLRDLLSNNYCTDLRQRDKEQCIAAGNEWRVASNWKGPYLEASSLKDIKDENEALIATIPVFRDGWGNHGAMSKAPDSRDNLNFGWDFTVDKEKSETIRIASLGLNGSAKDDSSSAKYIYERDSFRVITASQIKGASIKVNIVNNSGQADASFCIKAIYPDGSDATIDLSDTEILPAAEIFGEVKITGLVKDLRQPSCSQAKPYDGIEKSSYYAHNLFNTQKMELEIN